MYRHMGHHFVKKYNHALVVDTVYQDQKPSRGSDILTSASSRPSRDKSSKINTEEHKKRSRTYLFSPQLSLRKYKSKAKCQNSQNCIKNGEKEVKLIISTMAQNLNPVRAMQPPQKDNQRQMVTCSQCQSRQKSKHTRYLKMLSEQQNINTSNLMERIGEMKGRQQKQSGRLQLNNKIIIVAHRISSRRPSFKVSPKKTCVHLSTQFKPWDMMASESSI